MGVNLDKPHLWKADIARSVDMYNDWFMKFAPAAFRETRAQTTGDVERALKATANLSVVDPEILRKHPEILPTLRMATCPPLAVDRLIGLARVPGSLVYRIEKETAHAVEWAGPRDRASQNRGYYRENGRPRHICVVEPGQTSNSDRDTPCRHHRGGSFVRVGGESHYSKCPGETATGLNQGMARG